MPRKLLLEACQRLRQAKIPSPALDARLLLAHALGIPAEDLVLRPPSQVSEAARERFLRDIEARCQATPVAYLLGHREFFGQDFRVGPGVLIPRPDSETLVEAVLARVPEGEQTGIDIGTGSGCLAASLAGMRPAWKLFASDLSPRALGFARLNLPPEVGLMRARSLEALASGSMDFILSNPPYVDPATQKDLAPDLSHEPELALFAEERGMRVLRELIEDSPRVLRPGGWLFLEHGFDQGPATRALAFRCGFLEVETLPDLAGRDRVTVATGRGSP